MTNLFRMILIDCVDMNVKLILKEPPTTRILDTMTSQACTVSARIAVVSARCPTHEVRGIQDRDDCFNMLLGSVGEAVHHQINCLRCCSSHGGRQSCLFGFVEREVTKV